MKLFYDHLIMIGDVFAEIEHLEIEDNEKKDLKKLIDGILHHRVIECILDLLPREHHETFLDRLHKKPFDITHLKFLEDKSNRDIAAELVSLGEKLKKELIREIKKHKKK